MKKLIACLLLLVMVSTLFSAAYAEQHTLTPEMLRGTWMGTDKITTKLPNGGSSSQFGYYILIFWEDGHCDWMNTFNMNAQETVDWIIVGNTVIITHKGEKLVFTLVEKDGIPRLQHINGPLLSNAKFNTTNAPETVAEASPVPNNITIFENDKVRAEFKGFSYYGVEYGTEYVMTTPNIIITNKTAETINFKIDWQRFYLNSCKIEVSNTSETEIPANGKTAFTAARVCVINLGDFMAYGEEIIKNVKMDITFEYGNKSETVTWNFDCDVDIKTIKQK